MKVGDYVRLDRCQGINKIDEEDEIGTFYLEDVIGDEWGDETFRLDTNDVIKSSPFIIDLIEVGDYVNGCPVLHKENNVLICGLLLWYKEENIENVVTKEQFESIKYDLGE